MGVFLIQSWCAEWPQQMAAKVRLGKCADASGVLGLLCRLLWFDLDLDLNGSSRGSPEVSKTRQQSYLHKDLMTEKDDNWSC